MIRGGSFKGKAAVPSRTTKQASNSSTDHGGEKRRAVIAQTLMVESLLTNEAGTPTHR